MQWIMPGGQGADLKANITSLEEAAQIYEGIAGRIRDGTAANAKAIESAKRTVPLSQASWEYAQKAGAV